MSLPTSRDQFKEYCLRKLGNEVLDIDTLISDNQVEDRIDEALLFWQDYNIDATWNQYYKYQITSTDITNKYITLPSNIIGAVEVFDVGDAEGSQYIFNIRYQIALNDLYTLTSVSMVPYYMAYSHLQLLEQLLVGKKAIRYNRITNQLFLDLDWSQVQVGEYFIVNAYTVIDPTAFTNMWSDRTLQRYASALIKRQLGTNIKLFGNVPMPGGVMLNGQIVFDEATREVKEVEEEIRTSYAGLPLPRIG